MTDSETPRHNEFDAQSTLKASKLALGFDSDTATRGQALITDVYVESTSLQIVLRGLAGANNNEVISIDLKAVAGSASSTEELGAFLSSKVFPGEFLPPVPYVVERRRPLAAVSSRAIEIDKYVLSNYAEEVRRNLSSGRDVVVTGKSASGKTVAGLQAALSLARGRYDVQWLDLSEPDRDVWDILAYILRSPVDQTLCFFVDDAQANPGELAHIAQVQAVFGRLGFLRFHVAILAWTSFRQTLIGLWTTAVKINVNPDKVLRELSSIALGHRFSDLERRQLEHMVGGDLVTATMAMGFMNKNGRFPSGDELANEALISVVGKEQLSKEQVEILYRAASLSQFEIDGTVAYLELVSKSVVRQLLSRRVLRRNGHYLSIGHRSSSRLLLRGLAKLYSSFVVPLPTSSKIAVEYLRTADPRQLVATLERLDVARIQGSSHDQHGTKFLVRLWATFRMLLGALADAGARDPSWHDDTGSASCACRVLSEFNYECAEQSVEIMRNRWQLKESGKLVPTPPPPNERKDFDEIRRCMASEEGGGAIPVYAERHDEIDFDRMHRTWSLGFLIGLESNAMAPSALRLAALKSLATRMVQPNGSYYPSRVPWVSARILIGLSQAGESVETSTVVQRACEWLLRESPEGPCEFGGWRPYTGNWNTTLGTTAMCLNALVRCGVPISHPSLDLAIGYLQNARSEWSRTGQEIDCAFAVETFLLTGASWREYTPELTRLIDWANDPKIWHNIVLDASRSKDESLKIPLIAGSMVDIIWSIVRSELPLLLEDLATGTYLPDAYALSDYRRELRTIIEQLEEIRSHIRKNIEQRIMLLSAHSGGELDSVRKKLSQFRDLGGRCDEVVELAKRLTSQSTTSTSGPLFDKLFGLVNALGVDVFGQSWQTIRRDKETK